MQIQIVVKGPDKELYLFGKRVATWDIDVPDDMILDYAVEEAKAIGKREKAEEIRKTLGV